MGPLGANGPKETSRGPLWSQAPPGSPIQEGFRPSLAVCLVLHCQPAANK